MTSDPDSHPDEQKGLSESASAFVGYDPYSALCPTRHVLGLISDKWTSLVIVLLARGTKRFQQLRREIDGITQKMLTQTLRDLERNGLVNRRVYAEVPPRVEYSLTPLGRTLIEPLAGLHVWAVTHVEEMQAAGTAAEPRDLPALADE